MKLTKKLISFLNRVFEKDPLPFLALRIACDGSGLTWTIENGILTTVPTGGTAAPLNIDLTLYTIVQLVSYIAAQPGYRVLYVDTSPLSLLLSAVLLDGTGDVSQSNGDHLYGYTNETWSYLQANARELNAASDQVGQMLLQMSTKTGADIWLDELGSYYKVPRLQGELDPSYSLRIVAEVLRPIANNVAMEAAISVYTGQTVTVTDVVINTPGAPLYNGASLYDGSKLHNSLSTPRYGLFDVQYGYDLINGGDVAGFTAIVVGLIDRMRDAGTHLRSLTLTGSVLQDNVTMPTDGSSLLSIDMVMTLADTSMAPSESLLSNLTISGMADTGNTGIETSTLSVTYSTLHNGLRSYNGAVPYVSGSTISGTIEV